MGKEGYFASSLGFMAIAVAVVQKMNTSIPPIVGWPIVGLLGIAAILFLIIGIRKKESQQTLVLTVRSWAIGLTGMTGYPKEPENAAWLLLDVSVNAIERPIDTLDVIIDGKTIPANHWHGKIVTSFHVCFNVTEWWMKGKNQVELIAYVGDKMHRSGRKNIDFNVEPGVIGHRI